MRKPPFNLPLTLITVLLVLLIAGLAGSTLVVLRRMHGRSAHQAAAQAVIQQGQAMVARLSAQPTVSASDNGDWSEFSRLVRNLHTLEDGLQYVSVSRDDVVVFHEQTRLLDGTPSVVPETAVPLLTQPITMHRELLRVGREAIPVVVFETTITGPDDKRTRVRVALRKDTVYREEQTAETAITSMFRLALLTVLVSFGICTVLVAWMMRREGKREALRREEEHLAFSGMLANGIVHDFRNPMSSMQLDVQMLDRESKKGDAVRLERIQHLAQRIHNTLDRMDNIFQEFLFASRPDRETPVSFELITCIRDALDMLTPRFERAEVTPHITTAEDDIRVLAYETSVRRALINVLTNAEQFAPAKTAVQVRLHTEANYAIVDIADRGPGIPKTKRKQVFDMFVTGRPEGTGLGLFFAKAAVERSGGSIAVIDNKPAPGTCIRIFLPLAIEKPPHAQ